MRLKITLRDKGSELQIGSKTLRGHDDLIVVDGPGIRQMQKSGIIRIEELPESKTIEEPKKEITDPPRSGVNRTGRNRSTMKT